jgi:colanic acid/amylovoran biosynthesis glycosyltransferase
LTIVGEGPESDQLKRTAEEESLPVRFLGKKSPAEIRELLRQAAVLCAPSTTAGGEIPEALGLVLLEAQAMSVPVVATRNGGIPETLEDGRTGYLVEEESPAALADALAKLLNDEALNRSFGQRARALVCDRFDIDRCYGALEKLYDQIKERGR